MLSYFSQFIVQFGKNSVSFILYSVVASPVEGKEMTHKYWDTFMEKMVKKQMPCKRFGSLCLT